MRARTSTPTTRERAAATHSGWLRYACLLALLCESCLLPDVNVGGSEQHADSTTGAGGAGQSGRQALTESGGSPGVVGAVHETAGATGSAGVTSKPSMAGTQARGSGGDAGSSHATDLDAGSEDAGPTEPPSPPTGCEMSVCAVVYPCREDVAGYTCRGQFYDWQPQIANGASAFSDNRNGTVTDTRSALVWQQTVPASYAPTCTGDNVGQGKVGDDCTWEEAKAYCAQLPLAGGGWRLPTKAELESLVDDRFSRPAIDSSAFPGTPADSFWSSSPFALLNDSAWYVQFWSGESAYFNTIGTDKVRCVRP